MSQRLSTYFSLNDFDHIQRHKRKNLTTSRIVFVCRQGTSFWRRNSGGKAFLGNCLLLFLITGFQPRGKFFDAAWNKIDKILARVKAYSNEDPQYKWTYHYFQISANCKSVCWAMYLHLPPGFSTGTMGTWMRKGLWMDTVWKKCMMDKINYKKKLFETYHLVYPIKHHFLKAYPKKQEKTIVERPPSKQSLFTMN